MSMEVTAWNAMYNAMHAQQDSRPFSRATLRRVGGTRGRTGATSRGIWC